MTERLSGPGHSKTALRRGMGKFANPPPGAAATTAEEQAFLMEEDGEDSAPEAVGQHAHAHRIQIRELRPDDSLDTITTLLHEAYAPLAGMGLRYLASHQDSATTKRRLKRGIPFVATREGALIGTVTLYPPATESPCAWYMRPGVYCFGQFAIRPDLQRQGIGSRLLRVIEARARECGAAELALDTAEGATHLRAWYERLGFRFIGNVSWDVTNYRSVVLSKNLAAHPHALGKA